jgi:CDP-diacylglycerol--glycerol-3-phosphate 3-phosphatidyltransferase
LATIYDLKPKFQVLLRLAATALAHAGVTANAVTVAALVLSIAQGAWLALQPGAGLPLLVMPVTLFLRMALNAIDGSWPRSMGLRPITAPCSTSCLTSSPTPRSILPSRSSPV